MIIKILLLVSTGLQLSVIGVHFIFDLWFMNNPNYKYTLLFTIILHYFLVAIILRNIWTDNTIHKNKKTNNTLMILFLGIVGMWFWFHNTIKQK